MCLDLFVVLVYKAFAMFGVDSNCEIMFNTFSHKNYEGAIAKCVGVVPSKITVQLSQ